ncbi:hypothetical protein [Mycobacterium sp. GA-1199]|nr:hypothetical protein [Mycobacterium sp. GA-1199]
MSDSYESEPGSGPLISSRTHSAAINRLRWLVPQWSHQKWTALLSIS